MKNSCNNYGFWMNEGLKFQESKCRHARHREVDKEEYYFSTPFTGKQLKKTFNRTYVSVLMISNALAWETIALVDHEIEF